MSNLEKLITQKAFENENQRGLISLIFVGNWITSRHQQFFKQYGITMQQFNILRILRGQHPQAASINILKERMLDKMSDVSRLVERLRKADLVERKNSEMDRRAVDVRINDKGLELLRTIDNELTQLDNAFQSLSEKEIIQLNKLLDKMLESYH
ncbi:MarR family winged helix-turn-helix transcriptional regulator [Chitinophaga arvensicola]|uniref:DNA-binding transcriptional regulator, MarR family n=1 Tax=Chitinophaga arvensicola TaxID=29529 RepID=A0A1I0SD07_9BACT|nr:MarR family transcriptional regulator [Chitinophaga arvensicola]SEW55585.1 DNA-binding transcriptional regulator, MarR family [Chitinophaga arvensicola]